MIFIINIVVGSIIALLLIASILSCTLARRKYDKMINTMNDLEHDKNLLLIEKEYRRSFLKKRLEHIKIFVDKEFYQIKIFRVPLYVVEDFSIYGVYFSILLGITFTFINIALSTNIYIENLYSVYVLAIFSFFNCMIIMLARTLSGIYNLRDIFKIQLCSYLECELELFDEVMTNEEVNQKGTKIQKDYPIYNDHEEGEFDFNQPTHTFLYNFSTSGEGLEERLEDYDENGIINVLEEIFS